MKSKYNLKSDLIKFSCFVVVWLYIGTWLAGVIFMRGFIPLLPALGWSVKAVNHHGKPVSGKSYRSAFFDKAPGFVRVADSWFYIEDYYGNYTHVSKMEKPFTLPYLSIMWDDGVTDEDIASGREIIYHERKNLFISRVDETVFFSNEVFSVSVSKKNTNPKKVVEPP